MASLPINLAIGVRAAVGRGRQRSALLLVGAALTVFAGLGVIAGAVVRHLESTRSSRSILASAADAPNLGYAFTRHDYQGRTIDIHQVAALRDPTPPLIGLDQLPAAGELLVSPALDDAMRHDEQLRRWFPERLVGRLPPELVGDAGRLTAYVGAQPFEVAAIDPRIAAAGQPVVVPLEVNRGWGHVGVFGAVLFVVVPAAAFLVVVSRLGAMVRARRTAALRLLGMSRASVAVVAATEALLPAALGAGLGWMSFAAASEAAHRVPLVHRWFYPDDVLHYQWVAPVVSVVVVAAAMAANIGPVWRASTLGRTTRFHLAHRLTSRWMLAASALGVVALLGALQRARPGDPLLTVGMVAFGVGLPACLMVVVQRTSAVGSRLAHRVSSLMAFRRLEAEPARAVRVAGIAALGVYAVCAVQPWSQVFASGDGTQWLDEATRQGRNVLIGTATGPDQVRLSQDAVAVWGQRGQLALPAVGVWDDDDPTGRPRSALVATCQQLETLFDRSLPNCMKQPFRLERSPVDASGQPVPINQSGAEATSSARQPAGGSSQPNLSLRGRNDKSIAFDAPTAVLNIPTSLDREGLDPTGNVRYDWVLPPDHPVLRTIHDPWLVGGVVLMDADEDAWNQTQADVAATDPRLVFDNPYVQYRSSSNVGPWLAVGLLIAAGITLLTGTVIALDAAVSRQRELFVLRAFGVNRGMLVKTSLFESFIAGTTAMGLAIGGALLSTVAYWRMQADDPFPNAAPYFLAAGIGLTITLLIAVMTAATTPSRQTRPENHAQQEDPDRLSVSST